MINYRLTFRARIKKEDGTIWLFYQDTQYLNSFLRRVSSWLYFHHDDDDGKHESYLEQTVNEVLDQCTGKRDKNNKLIFEGDIVRTQDGAVMLIIWDEKYASFAISKNGWAFNHFFGEAMEGEDCEIIGNIWNNPELLNPK